jgi:hypothetical protein
LTTPSIGGVPWDGSIYLTPPAGLDPVDELKWRIDFDLVWLMENLVTITSKETNRPVPFVLNRPQAWAMWQLTEKLARGVPSWGWFLKGRQFGYSTLFMTILFLCSALRGQNSLLIAHREVAGKSIFMKGEMARQTLPTLEFPGDDDTVNVIELVPPPTAAERRSLMVWLSKNLAAVLRRDSAENLDAGVGETWQNAQFTEVPLWANPEHTIGYLIPALSLTPNTFVNAEFTARTEGDYAHSQWLQGMTPKGLFHSVFAAWYWHTPYAKARTPDDDPFTPEEEAYREMVAARGSVYPLADDGRLIPAMQAIYDRKGRIDPDDLEVGFELSDEQLLWRRAMIAGFAGNMAKWRTECPYSYREAFATAGRKLIDPTVIGKMEASAADHMDYPKGSGEYVSQLGSKGKGRARWMPRRDGRVHRFEMPTSHSTYLVDCDPSSGTGVDPAGIHVLKVQYQKVKVVASFEGFERPYELARLLARLGRAYRDDAVWNPAKKVLEGGRPAEIAVERNIGGGGEHIIHELTQVLGYRRVARYTDQSKDNWKRGHDYGFPTTRTTKVPMLLQLAQGCYDEQLVVPCRRTLVSLKAMQYIDDDDEDKIAAPKGQHDDLAMAVGIGFHFAIQKAAFRLRPSEPEPEWLKDRVVFDRAG